MVCRWLTLALSVVALATPHPTRAQPATVVGLVTRDSTGLGVERAEVWVSGYSQSLLTNSRGGFRIDALPAGRYAITIRRVGFKPFSDSIVVTAGQRLERQFVMTEQPYALDSVRVEAPATKYVSPNLRDFEERRKLGFGYFLSEDEFRKGENKTMTSMLVGKLPGIAATRTGGGQYLATMRKCGNGPVFLTCVNGYSPCYVALYVDGVLVFNPAVDKDPRQAPDLDRMVTREYAAAEFYQGGATLPAKYNMTSSNCGTLLLWSRER
jgi:hypothetical protein